MTREAPNEAPSRRRRAARAPRGLGRSRGAASVEYALVTAAVVLALFVDLPGLGTSALGYALDALRHFQLSTSFHLSLP